MVGESGKASLGLLLATDVPFKQPSQGTRTTAGEHLSLPPQSSTKELPIYPPMLVNAPKDLPRWG